MNNFSVAAAQYNLQEVSTSQSQFYGPISGQNSFSVFELQISAQAEIAVMSFDFLLNAGGSLSFSDPQLVDFQGGTNQVANMGHLQYRITLDSPLVLRAGESAQFQIVLEVTAFPEETGVLQATLTDMVAVSRDSAVAFTGPIAGPLVVFEGAPIQVEILSLTTGNQTLSNGSSNELLRVRVTALEDATIQGVNLTLFKSQGLEVESIEVLDGSGNSLVGFIYPFLTQNETTLGGSLLFNTPIQLQAGQSVELEYRVGVSFNNSNLGIQAQLSGIPGILTTGAIFGPYKES
ncbi:MAG: hypothetical protein AB7J40_01785 [Candidatus Altimarinota bacterium]